MIGCFNISGFSYFDIHRIFDLISCRLWDFILWWFDLDFLLFDFNFDFILCLSFIFIFLIHFFFKLLFSFLINFIIINKTFHTYKNYINFTITCVIHFLSYILLIGTFYLFHIIEIFTFLNTICFVDFTSFSDNTYLENKNYKSYNTQISYIYLMFYYMLILITKFYLLLFRHFYTQSYINQSYVDQINTNKTLDLNNITTLPIYIIEHIAINNTLNNIYLYLILLNCNLLITQNMILIFYIFNVFNYNHKNNIYLQILKINKYLYNLNNNYIILFYKNIFSNIVFIYLFIYIIFLINFLGIFIKDFNHIVITVNNTLLLLIFSIKIINFNTILCYWYKKQLHLILYY